MLGEEAQRLWCDRHSPAVGDLRAIAHEVGGLGHCSGVDQDGVPLAGLVVAGPRFPAQKIEIQTGRKRSWVNLSTDVELGSRLCVLCGMPPAAATAAAVAVAAAAAATSCCCACMSFRALRP